MTTPLCPFCTTLFTSTPPFPTAAPNPYSLVAANTTEYVLLESTAHSFRLGAENGCRFCTLCNSGDTFEMLQDLNRNGKLEEDEKFRLRILLVVPDENRNGEGDEEEGRYPVLKILFGGGPDEGTFMRCGRYS